MAITFLLLAIIVIANPMPTPEDDITVISITHDLDELPAEVETIEADIKLRIDTLEKGVDCDAHYKKLRSGNLDFDEERDWISSVCRLDAWDVVDTKASLNLLKMKLKYVKARHDGQINLLLKPLANCKDEQTAVVNHGFSSNYNDIPKYKSSVNHLLHKLNDLFYAGIKGILM